METTIRPLGDRTIVTTGTLATVFRGENASAAEQIGLLQQRVAELEAENWYWDNECLESASASIAEAIECCEPGEVRELRPLHELPTIYVRVEENEHEYEVFTSREVAEAARREGD